MLTYLQVLHPVRDFGRPMRPEVAMVMEKSNLIATLHIWMPVAFSNRLIPWIYDGEKSLSR